MRHTKKRELIWDIIRKADKPLSAEMINSLLNGGTMNLSTIYRNLDQLHQQGIIGKSMLEGSAYYYLNHHDHHHYMICRSCQKMVPIDCHLDDMAKAIAKKERFTITGHDMTIYGYCHECYQNQIPNANDNK